MNREAQKRSCLSRSRLHVGMGLIKSRHGVWLVRHKVPVHLEAPVARVLGRDKDRQAYLQESTGTKDKAEAKRIAVDVLAGFQDTPAQTPARCSRLRGFRPDLRSRTTIHDKKWTGRPPPRLTHHHEPGAFGAYILQFPNIILPIGQFFTGTFAVTVAPTSLIN